jgi:D-3-phosphoglycerate dehydrogenase
VGIIGVGRIGSGVLEHLTGFEGLKILVNDTKPNIELAERYDIEWVDKDRIFCEADIVTLHTPLTPQTKNMVTKQELMIMKEDAIIINTARGGIINEKDLYEVMRAGHLSGASIDVFNIEPYCGNLRDIQRCILTAHMGSMSVDCRMRMEIEATQEAIRFLIRQPLENQVPKEEYTVQRQGL